MARQTGGGMKCTLCGLEFNEGTAHATCQGCGIVKACDLVKCPNCGFENAPEPKWLKKLLRKQEGQGMDKTLHRPNLRLDELNVNQKARISSVQTENRNALQKMIAIGALPNTELILLQKFPSFVFQMGFSQFSIDRELASCIYVTPV